MTKFEKVSLARYQKDRAEILLREGMSLEEAYQVAEQNMKKSSCRAGELCIRLDMISGRQQPIGWSPDRIW